MSQDLEDAFANLKEAVRRLAKAHRVAIREEQPEEEQPEQPAPPVAPVAPPFTCEGRVWLNPPEACPGTGPKINKRCGLHLPQVGKKTRKHHKVCGECHKVWRVYCKANNPL